MAPSPSDLKEVFDTSLSDSSLQKWIDLAGDRLKPLDLSALTSAEQDRLHLMLAAHYAMAQDPRHTQVSSSSRQLSLRRTEYGRIAMGLDPTNSLGASRDSDRTLTSTSDE